MKGLLGIEDLTRAEVQAMLAGLHPDGLKCPPDIAIAHHLIKTWALGEK